MCSWQQKGINLVTNWLLMQFDELKDQVAVEQILQVVFLEPDRASPVSRSSFHSFPICFAAKFIPRV